MLVDVKNNLLCVGADASSLFAFHLPTSTVLNNRTTEHSATAGLPFSYKSGCHHNFCCGGPISNPRPVLESSAQTTRANVLGFFVKPQTRFFAFLGDVF